MHSADPLRFEAAIYILHTTGNSSALAGRLHRAQGPSAAGSEVSGTPYTASIPRLAARQTSQTLIAPSASAPGSRLPPRTDNYNADRCSLLPGFSSERLRTAPDQVEQLRVPTETQ